MNFLPTLTPSDPLAGKASDYVLLTGATGLLGRFLMRDFLLSGRRLAVLVRTTELASASERVESILQMWEGEGHGPLSRPVVLEGDVTEPHLGLSAEDLEWVSKHVVSILHAAAMVRFDPDETSGEPMRTNLGGTLEVIDLATRMQIPDLHYVSTAFVCGKREGVIRENELDCQQTFHNSYEQSKFEAEQAVRAATQIPWRTVYRPTIITADSTTGYTNTYFGISWYLKWLAVLVPQQPVDERGIRQTPIDLPVSGDEPHNLVPVNWVSRVILTLFANRKSRGQTFHLSSPHSVTMREVIEICYGYFGSAGVRFVGDQPSGSPANMSAFARSFFESSRSYRDYDRYTPVFDRSRLDALAGHLECPPIDRDVVLRFLEFGRRDRWGKRRHRPVRIQPLRAQKALADMLQPTRTHCLQRWINGYKLGLGVNLVGPGGGQWRLVPDDAGDWQLERGLGSRELPVKSLTLGELTDQILLPEPPVPGQPAVFLPPL